MQTYFLKNFNLGFRQYHRNDAETIANWINDEEVNQFFVQNTPHSYERMLKVIEKVNTDDNNVCFIVDDIENNTPVGIIEIRGIDYIGKKCTIEMAIGNKKYWGKGYGYKMLSITDDYVFNKLSLNKVKLHIMAINEKMVTLAKKCGYTVEGYLKDELYKNGYFYDEIIFSKILKSTEKMIGSVKAINNNILDIIGNTPIVKINNNKWGVNNNIFAKLEFLNPSGSVKDRAAYSIISNAEKEGLINKDTTVVEATSGNIGISLATVCAIKNIKLILTAPYGVVPEGKLKIITSLGAKVIFTPIEYSYDGAVKKAVEIANGIENSFLSNQFKNENNFKAHINTTAIEIIQQMGSSTDVFISTIGSGGTITGVGSILKKYYPKIKIIAVEPETCTVLSNKKRVDVHYILGIGPGFIPEILDTSVIDDVITVSDEQATRFCVDLARNEGIFCGISSGAAIAATINYAKKEKGTKNILTIFPDNGVRYVGKKGFFMDSLNERFNEENLVTIIEE